MAKVRSNFKDDGPKHFIREWRKHRGLSQERLAERLEVTHGAISQLERGRTQYTQPMLEALADALNCAPGDLIMRNPIAEGALWSILDQLVKAEPQKQSDVVKMIEIMLRKTGTDG